MSINLIHLVELYVQYKSSKHSDIEYVIYLLVNLYAYSK